MFNHLFYKITARRASVLVAQLIIISMIVTACGGAAGTQAPGETEVPTEVPTEAATEVPTETPEAVELVFWFAGTPEEREYLAEQINNATFLQEQQISVTPMFFSFEEYDAKLATALAAGEPVDVAVMSLNLVVEQQAQGTLSPLDPEKITQPDDFREDALASGQIDGVQYGLALRQFGCVPVYQYLVQPKGTSYLEQGMMLIDFLTQVEQQENAFQALGELGWLPTRQSVYDSVGIDCPPAEPIRRTPEEISTSINVVKERASNLESVLEGVQLNPYEAVTVIENGEIQGTLAAPLTIPSDQEALDKLQGEGLVIGALFIDKAPEYEPGDYAWKCTATITPENNPENWDCFLVDDKGTRVETDPDTSQDFDLSLPISKPVVVVEALSSQWTCTDTTVYIFGKPYTYKRCRLVG